MKVFNHLCLLLSLIATQLVPCVHAKRSLKATSLVTCDSNSLITPEMFDVVFDPDTGALRYDIKVTTELSGYIFADAYVYAYGFQVIKQSINFCNIGWKQFCPMYPGSIEIDSIQYLSRHYVNMIPEISYTFPDIDALARVIIKNSTGDQVGCLQASFTNGKTVSHVGAKWATAVVAGIGLLASALLSSFGNSSSASRISANAVSLFTYFQSVVIICMTHVQQVPPIAAAWSENLAWSMGLIRVTFMQKIFRWYVQATGGTPTQYLTNSSISTLIQRSYTFGKTAVKHAIPFFPLLEWAFPSLFLDDDSDDYITDYLDLEGRDILDVYNLKGTKYLKVIRGIDRTGLGSNIEPTSIVCTGFTFFVLCLYVLVAAFFIFRIAGKFVKGKGKSWFNSRERNWNGILKGVLQRYIYIGFPQLLILSLWEFTKVDSAAVVVIAVLFLILSCGIMGWALYRTLSFGAMSVKTHRNAAAILYGDPNVLSRYGFFYTMFNAKKYWFGAVIVGHIFVKGLFVALAQGSGKTQALAIFIIDLVFTIYLIREKPYLDKATNIVNILMAVVMLLNSFFFLFFSGLFGQPAAVSSVMGLIFFFLNAIFSLVLLILIIVYTLMALTSKNPDARFAPAKDDRTSFQKKDANGEEIPDGAQELFELGQVAKDHNSNWANEMYKLRDMVESSDNTAEKEKQQNLDEPLQLTGDEEKSFGGKLVSKLTGGKSMLRKLSRKGTKSKKTNPIDHPLPSTVNEAQGGATGPTLGSSDDGSYSSNEKRNSPGEDSLLKTAMHSLDPSSKSKHGRSESNTPIMNTFPDTEPSVGFRSQLNREMSGNISDGDLSLYNNGGSATTPAPVYK
ncbi:unnamed protein product [Ambrosiozyma monospora]|uniref:Unnamed protein product n=1 Tax=Ambrosiozyma monospora TaxID=43982 RepID=A0ACB5ST93_AMBMO|nr:unnamed protein product [Ambrosiozyma monospora]